MLSWLTNRLPLGLALMALLVAVGAYMVSRNAHRRVEATNQLLTQSLLEMTDAPTDELHFKAIEALAEARQINERMEGIVEATDVVLGFVEGGFTILTVLLAVAAVVFGLNISEIRQRVDKTVDEAQEHLIASENRVKQMETDMMSQLLQAELSDKQRMEESIAQLTGLRDQMRHQLEEAAHADEVRLRESEEQFARLNARIENTLSQTEQTFNTFQVVINEAVSAAQRRAENTFRALSLVLLAEQQIRAHNRETAISTLEEAIPLDPDNQTTNYLLGYLYVGRKRFEDALTFLDRALQSNPNFAPALAAKGLALSRLSNQIHNNPMRQNQFRAEAEVNLTKALQSDPSLLDADGESYFATLGGIYKRQNRMDEAVDAYQQAVSITPSNSYPIGNLANLYKSLGHEEDAHDAFLRVIRIAETKLENELGDIWTRFDLALGYIVTGQLERALAQYDVVYQQGVSVGELEIALEGLRVLATAPTPPDGIEQAITKLSDLARGLNG